MEKCNLVLFIWPFENGYFLELISMRKFVKWVLIFIYTRGIRALLHVVGKDEFVVCRKYTMTDADAEKRRSNPANAST